VLIKTETMNYQFSSMGWQSLSACCKLLADLPKLDLANEREPTESSPWTPPGWGGIEG